MEKEYEIKEYEIEFLETLLALEHKIIYIKNKLDLFSQTDLISLQKHPTVHSIFSTD